MKKKWMERTALMVGDAGLDKLIDAHVLVMGLGGVGSYAAEALARAGIGTLTIVDGDVVDPTNRNRQLQALSTTHGQSKAKLMQERLLQINPEIQLHVIDTFQDPTEIQILVSKKYNYVVDAIDSISPKLFLLKAAFEAGNKIVSSMGAGGKMDPTMLQVVDISKTYTCPLAQQIRKKLREHLIFKGIKAVFSTELPMRESIMHTDGTNYKKSAYGTISYLPAVFGLTCASVVIRDITEWQAITAQQNARKKTEL